jgi:hypothetical protein
MVSNEGCDTCRYWQEICPPEVDATDFVGECRRHAPRPITTSKWDKDFKPAWAVTHETDWCGEWKPRTQRTVPD